MQLGVKYDAKQISEKCEGPILGCYSTDEAQKSLPLLRVKGDLDTNSGQQRKIRIKEMLPRPKEHQAKEF